MIPLKPKTSWLATVGVIAPVWVLCLLPACQPKQEAPAEAEKALPVTTTNDAPAPAAPRPNTIRYEAQSTGSELRIAGTSTIHDWTVTNKIVGGFLEADASFPASATQPDASTSAPKVEVFIPVRAFKSYNKKMDEIMLEHLNSSQFPKIEYRLLTLTPKAGAATDGAMPFDATGLVTVSGVTRTNVMPVTIQRVDQAKLKVTGSTPLKMTDFGVKPPAPALALGLIKTGDDVTITFEWLLAQKTAGTP
jgi:polyisoprenoid-binding protein YceI